MLEGDSIEQIGIIVQGIVIMEKNDTLGNRYVYTELNHQDLLGDPFMDKSFQKSFVNYKAITNCTILFFPYQLIWQSCKNNCICHAKFTENLLYLLAYKTRNMMLKIEILSKTKIRDKILTFLTIANTYDNMLSYEKISTKLNENYNKEDYNVIVIPFNRTEMAEYLCVNRCSLVRELASMKKEGILSFERNTFFLPKNY